MHKKNILKGVSLLIGAASFVVSILVDRADREEMKAEIIQELNSKNEKCN